MYIVVFVSMSASAYENVYIKKKLKIHSVNL